MGGGLGPNQTRTRRFGEHGSPKTELLVKAEEAARCPTVGHGPLVASIFPCRLCSLICKTVTCSAAFRHHRLGCKDGPPCTETKPSSATWHRGRRQGCPRLHWVSWPAPTGGPLESVPCPACPPCQPLLGEAWDASAGAWHFLQCQGTNPFVFPAPLLTERTCHVIHTFKVCASVAFPASSGVTSTSAHVSHLSKTPYPLAVTSLFSQMPPATSSHSPTSCLHDLLVLGILYKRTLP